jgi:pimeloyl-ACP methyl ester carboxylesterase
MREAEPLLLLPGLLCDAGLWDYQMTALAPVARPIVGDVTRSDSISGLALDVLAAAPPSFALAGLSMGGYVALEILRVAPERVTRLALLDTQARPDTEEARARRRGLIDLAKRGEFKGVTPRLLPQLLHPDHRQGPIADHVIAMAGRVGLAAFIRQQTAIMGRIDSLPSLSRITVPTLVLCGAEDTLTPPSLAQEMADAIQGAELVIVPQSGHLTPLERPEAVNRALIEWLG